MFVYLVRTRSSKGELSCRRNKSSTEDKRGESHLKLFLVCVCVCVCVGVGVGVWVCGCGCGCVRVSVFVNILPVTRHRNER